MKKIAIFYHIWLANNWKSLVDQQINTLISCGLLKFAERLHIGAIGEQSVINDFLTYIKTKNIEQTKLEIETSTINQYEYLTLDMLKRYCDKNDCYALYFHTKGISQPEGSPDRLNKDSWRKCLEYFNIERWEDCVKKLDEGYDTCGSDYRRRRRLYSGNFWWANSDFIKRTDPPLPLNKITKKGLLSKRFYYEYWFRKTKNRYYSFYTGHDDRYRDKNSPARTENIIEIGTIINSIVKKFNYETCLVIAQPKRCWLKIFNVIDIDNKIAIQPKRNGWNGNTQTADEFFKNNKNLFDLIFIDVATETNCIYRDIDNSLNCLKENGTIIICHCNPIGFWSGQNIYTSEPIKSKNNAWKAWTKLRSTREDLYMFVIDSSRGWGVIRKGKQKTIQPINDDIYYSDFAKIYTEALNIKSVDEFKQWISGDGAT